MSAVAAGLAAAALTALSIAAARAVTHAARSRRTSGRLVAPRPRPRFAPPAVERAIERAALPVDPVLLWRAWLAVVGIAAGAGWTLGGMAFSALCLSGAVAVPAIGAWLGRSRRDRAVEEQLPSALESIASALRSGVSLHQALASAGATVGGQVGDDLRRVAGRVAAGVSLPESFDLWARERRLPGVELAVAALVTSVDAGGAHARSLDGVAATLRDRHELRREVRALSSQARLSAAVIALAPPAFGVLVATADRATTTFLLRTPTGLACLTAGLALDGVAVAWMARLTRSVA